MRLVLQRTFKGRVTVGERVLAEIGTGLVILVGVEHGDTQAEADWLAEKCANLRIFEDDAGKMNRSVLEAGGEAIVVSQFTLLADSRKGRRPSFIDAALPEVAEPLVRHFAKALSTLGVPTQTGEFGAFMRVEIHNEGPVTILLERSPGAGPVPR